MSRHHSFPRCSLLCRLLAVLRRREGKLRGRQIAASLVRILAASALMGLVLRGALTVVSPDAMSGWKGAGILSVLIGASTLFYWLAAHLLGAPEPAELRRVARRRR